jgi:hypothetical protein
MPGGPESSPDSGFVAAYCNVEFCQISMVIVDPVPLIFTVITSPAVRTHEFCVVIVSHTVAKWFAFKKTDVPDECLNQ